MDPEKLYKSLTGRWDHTVASRSNWATAIRFAQGGQRRLLRGMPAEDGLHFDHKPKVTVNILGQIVTARSRLYIRDPVRAMLNEAETEWAQNTMWHSSSPLTAALLDIDWLTVLTGTVAVLTRLSKDRANRERFEQIPITRDRFVAVAHEDDPRKAAAYLVLVGSTSDAWIFRYYDDVFTARFERPRAMPDSLEILPAYTAGGWPKTLAFKPHGFETAPIDLVTNTKPTTDHMVDGVLGPDHDLIETCRSLNDMVTEIVWTAKLQRGQPWCVGKPQSFMLAPDSLFEVDEAGSFGITPNAADLTGMLAVVQAMLDMLTGAHGLPPHTFSPASLISSDSSKVLLAGRTALLEHHAAHAHAAAQWERDLHATAAAQWNATHRTNYTGELKIEFVPTAPILNSSERLAQVALEVDKGLTTKARAIRQLHPDLTEAEATELALINESVHNVDSVNIPPRG
jgi:hypothetical protein